MNSNAIRRFVAASVALAALGTSSPALADDPFCKDLPQPIIGIGGSATKPAFAKIGAALAGATPSETLIYQSPGACHGPNTIVSDNPKITGSASYWDKD